MRTARREISPSRRASHHLTSPGDDHVDRIQRQPQQPTPQTVYTPWQVPWPEGCIARYWTVAGATIDITHGDRTTPTDDGIGETRNHTTATCTGCPAAEEFSHWQVVKRMTFDDKVRDPE